MIRKYYDKIILALALAFLLVVFGLAAFRPAPQSITEFVDIPALRPENTFEVSPVPEPDLSVPRWEAPPPQSAGEKWVYDLVTPPVIYFNPQTETFTVSGVADKAPAPWGVELVAVREDLYRVQLIGYVGKAGDYLINLENLETGELLLAREGKEYPDFGIVVRSFKIEKVKVPHPGGTEVYENMARVVLYDQRLDQEVTLRSEARKKSDESTAHFHAVDAPEQTFRAGVGESFTHAGYTYTVDAIDPPARATVTRTGGEEDEPETKVFVAQSSEGETPSAGQAGEGGEGAPPAAGAGPASGKVGSDF